MVTTKKTNPTGPHRKSPGPEKPANFHRRGRKFFFSALLLGLTVVLSACDRPVLTVQPLADDDKAARELYQATEGPEPALIFGLTPYSNDELAIRRAFFPLCRYLSEKFKRKIRLVVTHDYRQLIDLVGQGKIHFGNFSTQTLAQALSEMGDKLTYIATSITPSSSRQSPYYRGALFSLKAGPVKSLSQVGYYKLALTDRNSASGFQYPLARLLDAGALPDNFDQKGRLVLAGGHQAVLRAVLNGDVRSGAITEGILKEAFEKEPDLREKIRILGYTGPIPNDGIAAGPRFPPKLADALGKLLPRLNPQTRDSRGHLVLAADRGFPYTGWTRKSREFYGSVLTVRRQIRKFLK